MTVLDLTNPAHQVLKERLQPYLEEATAASTRKAYRTDLRHFQEWGGTLPATPQLVADYLVAHAATLSPVTLKRRLVAIARAHNTLSLPNPTTHELVRLTMRGITRKHGRPQKQVKPLLKEDLLLIMTTLGDSPRDCRDRCLLLIGFCGAFRRSELVALNVEDLEFVREGVLITLRRSKTDQTGEGRKIGIPYARGRVCPVQALQEWLQQASITDGAIFRSMQKNGSVTCARLSDRSVANIIKERALAAGLDANDLSGHSLRAGLATSAAQVGIASHKIRAQTGHASDTMLARYVRDGELWTDNAGGLF